MQKFETLILCGILLLSGCSSSGSSESAAQAAYEGYYTSIETNSSFAESSLYYSVSAEMTEMSDSTYRYYIVIDNPQIAMYDIVVMAVENDIPLASSDKMMPNIGIFDSKEYCMIPFQSNPDDGYVKGIVISGETDSNPVSLKMLVEWKDRNHENTQREFLQMELTPDGITSSADPSASPEAEN
ncbi:MAG: hypothetical protein ACI4WR_00910 [Bulleidia sp.]